MEQIEPRYLQTIIDILNASGQPVKRFEYGMLKLEFHDKEPEKAEVPEGFTAMPPPKPPASPTTLADVYKRLTGTSVPEFMPKPPTKSEG